MEFVFTDAFYSSYQSLSDEEAVIVDDGIRRILRDHASGWARQGRIEGESGGSWIAVVESAELGASLYWDYFNGETVVLLALTVRHR